MEFPARDPAPQLPPRSADLLHEPLLRGLLEHASTMITVKDVHGRFLLVNPAFARAFGREPADLVGLSTRDVVPRSLAAAWSAHDHQVITSGVALQAPERFPGEQGKLVDCIATKFPLFGEDGTVVAIGSLRVEIGDLEAARDALEDSERRFQALFEQSAVGQIECDLRGRLTALNPIAVALLGLPAAPATVPAPTTVRTSIADVLSVPAGDDLHAQLRSVLTGPELQHHGLHHLIRPDGRRVAALVTATAVHGTGDGVRGALITLVDTSEQERAESQLLLSEQRSRSLLQSMPDAVVVVDAEGRIRDVNHQTETLFGYDAAELLGSAVEVLVPVGERRAHPARRSSYVAQADPQPMSTGSGIVGRRKDGSDVPVEISLAAVALEDGPAVIAAVRDVTATRALQQQLHDSEELFRLAFDRAPTGMALGGLRGADRGRFLRVNRALCRLTGYEEGDFLGRDAGFLNHPDDQRISREAVDGLAGGESESFRAEKRYRHAEGHDVWVLVSASVVRDRDGTPSYTVVQVEDITARKRAEEALAQRARTTSVIASTLQRALLPYALVSPPGVELASRYRAAGDRSEIGGDWYDTVELPTGGLALIIGDVEGHDLTASSVMGMVRGAVRSYALEGHPPSVIVQQVNTFLFSTGIERLVTLGYLQLYPDDHLLTVTLAGHLAPLVVPQDGSPVVPLDVTPGLPLGVTPDAHWKEQTLLLPADVTLALYTDGLLEPASSPADPLARVLALAAGAARRGADDVADALLEDAPTYDDVAVLVARLTGAHSPQAARTLPAQAISAAIARLWVDDLLRLWEASGRLEAGLATSDRAETTQLLVTELVSNATRHSDRTVGLRAQLSGNRLRLDVSDSSHRMPVLRRPGLGETSGRGLALLDTLSTSWGVDLDEQGKRVWFELDLDAVEDLDAFEAFGGDEFGGDEAELLAAFPDL